MAPTLAGVANVARLSGDQWWRIVFAGPWTLVASVVVMASLATWLPPGVGKVDNIAFPLVLFPLIWAVLFFHASLARRLWRAVAVHLALTAGCTLLLAVHFLGGVDVSRGGP